MATITLADPTELPAGVRELNYRRDNGIHVALFWDQVTSLIILEVADEADLTRGFAAIVQPGEARFAFEHPFLFEPDREPVRRAVYATTETDRDDDDGADS